VDVEAEVAAHVGSHSKARGEDSKPMVPRARADSCVDNSDEWKW
jgi:hypothetical protein